MVRFICSTEMGATSRDPSQVKDDEVQAPAALQRAQARGRVVELVKGGFWPREWGISYVTYSNLCYNDLRIMLMKLTGTSSRSEDRKESGLNKSSPGPT